MVLRELGMDLIDYHRPCDDASDLLGDLEAPQTRL